MRRDDSLQQISRVPSRLTSSTRMISKGHPVWSEGLADLAEALLEVLRLVVAGENHADVGRGVAHRGTPTSTHRLDHVLHVVVAQERVQGQPQEGPGDAVGHREGEIGHAEGVPVGRRVQRHVVEGRHHAPLASGRPGPRRAPPRRGRAGRRRGGSAARSGSSAGSRTPASRGPVAEGPPGSAPRPPPRRRRRSRGACRAGRRGSRPGRRRARSCCPPPPTCTCPTSPRRNARAVGALLPDDLRPSRQLGVGDEPGPRPRRRSRSWSRGS